MELEYVKIPLSSLFFTETQLFFSTKYSLNCCKILVDFQSPKNADSDKFFNLFHCFHRRAKFTLPFLLTLFSFHPPTPIFDA